MIMLTLVVSVAGYAQTEIDGIYYNLDYIDYKSLNTGVAEVTHGEKKYSGNVVIPEKLDNLFYRTENYSVYKDYTVTRIGSDAFWANEDLNSVTIPNSVTSIGRRAFQYCSGLTSITIPNSVTYIYDDTFRYCSNLSSIIIESGNKRYDSRNSCNAIVETSSNRLITGCKNTTIPDTVEIIGLNAFAGQSRLQSLFIPASIKKIENILELIISLI